MLDSRKPMFQRGCWFAWWPCFCLKTILALNGCLNHFDSAFKP